MKSLLFSFLFLPFFWACTNEEASSTSENDVDAARNFLRAALDGEYDKARAYMLQDTLNNQYLEEYENIYRNRMNPDDKRGYRESSITIHSVRAINDSSTVVHYSNSYKMKPDSLSVVRAGNNWLVDFKYSFGAIHHLPATDSLP